MAWIRWMGYTGEKVLLEKSVQSIGGLLQSLIQPLFQKHPHLNLMMEWPGVVGERIGGYTWPSKLLSVPREGGILYLQVKPSYEMMAWADSVLILERVNQYFGCAAVAKIRLQKEGPRR